MLIIRLADENDIKKSAGSSSNRLSTPNPLVNAKTPSSHPNIQTSEQRLQLSRHVKSQRTSQRTAQRTAACEPTESYLKSILRVINDVLLEKKNMPIDIYQQQRDQLYDRLFGSSLTNIIFDCCFLFFYFFVK
jgi:hypothetical protein